MPRRTLPAGVQCSPAGNQRLTPDLRPLCCSDCVQEAAGVRCASGRRALASRQPAPHNQQPARVHHALQQAPEPWLQRPRFDSSARTIRCSRWVCPRPTCCMKKRRVGAGPGPSKLRGCACCL